MRQWIIGIDAGGSKCSASLFDQKGNEMAQVQTGSSNLFTDFTGAMQSIEQGITGLLSHSLALENKIKPSDCIVSIGAAGAGIESVQARFTAWQHSFYRTFLFTDLETACYGANEGEDCAFVVLGTGSCVAEYRHKEMQQYGGQGFLLGDTASGAWLGQKAIRWYLHALDLSVRKTSNEASLFESMFDVLGADTNQVITEWGKASPKQFASLTPRILANAESSKQVAAWLQEGSVYLQEILTQKAFDLPVFLGGGIAFIYKERLQKALNKTMFEAKQNARYGAFCLAKAQYS